jgi:NDP-sugar pyrophosphorylase family protein
MRALLELLGGESIVTYKEGDIVKVHVHTLDPGRVLTTAREFGEFLTVKIENMELGHSDVESAKKKQEQKAPKKPFTVITVATGEGITSLFEDMGADGIINGGQTNNPSTEEFIEAFDKHPADDIIVLPNNKNVMLAAKQAAELYKNARVQSARSFYSALFDEFNNGSITMNAYKFGGYVSCINSISSYYRANMDMLKMDVSTELFRSQRPVYTKIKDEPPTIYVKGCQVSNSLIADGCIIKGTVKNSVIGRFVEVEEGAVVENCIILQNIKIKANAKLHNVIVDKNVTISENTELRGNENFPLVIEKKNLL